MKKQIPHGDEDLNCPFSQKAMSLVCHKCPMWVQLRGKNPQSNEEIDQWNCSFAFLPVLLLENAQQVRQGAAATESFRNEMAAAHQENVAVATSLASLSNAGGRLLLTKSGPYIA